RRAAQELDRTRIAEGAHKSGVLDERAEVLAAGRLVPEGGEKVRLAHAETTIEVYAGLRLDALTTAAEEARRTRRLPRLRERLQFLHGLGLRRIVVVRAIGLERRVNELGRRHELGRDLGAGDRRSALGE